MLIVDSIVFLMIDVTVTWLSLSVACLDLNVKTSERENLDLVTEECVRVKVKSPFTFRTMRVFAKCKACRSDKMYIHTHVQITR